ncbi:ecdysteroid-phosphate phosphatase-like [Malaya genurostris]|uniref:ecdysteroid-phosphate phosphatase-like n=1 Tax=Malaya genurostris TaxID=325434 RepID=UPI0026F3E991|nr:ecdysteroid-phosphate phosphatase-like [Malaya genurostris]
MEQWLKKPSGPENGVADMWKLFETMKKHLAATVLTPDSDEVDHDDHFNTKDDTTKGRRVFVVRHAERVDFTFGNWTPNSFDVAGNYIRRDLNMPRTLPQRKICQWKRDTPLTNLGQYQARLTGEAMKDAGVQIDLVYSSPSFRCIQTASSILEGLGIQETIPIRVEPGLFEWLMWYKEGLPEWLSNEELVSSGYNIAMDYKPLSTAEDLNRILEESLSDHYKRNSELADQLYKTTSGNILIVGHASTLDTCTRHAVGNEILPTIDSLQLLLKIPYCSVVAIESTNVLSERYKWKFIKPPCAPISNTKNDRFDWKVLLNKGNYEKLHI